MVLTNGTDALFPPRFFCSCLFFFYTRVGSEPTVNTSLQPAMSRPPGGRDDECSGGVSGKTHARQTRDCARHTCSSHCGPASRREASGSVKLVAGVPPPAPPSRWRSITTSIETLKVLKAGLRF